MADIIFLDGKFLPAEKAKVSVFDHGLLYGDGVFEGIRLYDRCIFRLEQHLERLQSSAKYIALDLPLNLEELKWVTAETCRRNNLTDGYIRLVVTRGVGDLGLSPWLCKTPSIFVIAAKIKLYPETAYTRGLELKTVPTQRTGAPALHPRVKSCNYLNNILAKIEGRNAGVDEALMLNAQGYVIECTGDNIFIVKRGILTTPPSHLGALQGVTRDCIIEIARTLGYTVKEEPFTRFEVFDADECFMTGSAAEVVPVVNVDARKIGDGKPGNITKKLIERYRQLVTSEGTHLSEKIQKPKNFAAIWNDSRKR